MALNDDSKEASGNSDIADLPRQSQERHLMGNLNSLTSQLTEVAPNVAPDDTEEAPRNPFMRDSRFTNLPRQTQRPQLIGNRISSSSYDTEEPLVSDPPKSERMRSFGRRLNTYWVFQDDYSVAVVASAYSL